jgi:tRNA-guanine family transglycosylase
LLSIHNLTFYQRLMHRARQAIERGDYHSFLVEQRRRLAGTTGDEDRV